MTAYRNDVDALAARHAALAEEVATKTRERDEAARNLADAKARAQLPVLDNIRIASPCHVPWSTMVGDERVRHCGSCDKDVFNLSAMTRDEAQALITEKAGNLCARYYQRSDGTILLADCEIGAKQRRKRRLVAAGAAALLAGGASAALLARSSGTTRAPLHEVAGGMEPVAPMGVVAVDPEPVELGQSIEPDLHEVAGGIGRLPDTAVEVKGDLKQVKRTVGHRRAR